MVCSPAMVSGARAPTCFNRPHAQPSRSRSSRLMARATATSLPIAGESGTCSLQGTSRVRNEDRFSVQIADQVPSDSTPFVYAGVYDGHGGFATSEWLEGNLLDFISNSWNAGNTPEGIKEAFLSADRTLLKPSGFLGVGERGIGGSKCGSTCAAALVYKSKEGTLKLLSANVGDARVLLVRKDNSVVQLTEDHVPDSEKERKRIESMNPNKKLPLVRFVGGTWRVGGILALSRAFGDAYMKGSLQFEGIDSGSDYSSGFGVVAEPYTQLIDLNPGEDTWLIVCSDGMFANEERGGGSGLDNGQVAKMSNSASSAQQLAKDMCTAAQKAGSTDDVTVIALKINP